MNIHEHIVNHAMTVDFKQSVNLSDKKKSDELNHIFLTCLIWTVQAETKLDTLCLSFVPFVVRLITD